MVDYSSAVPVSVGSYRQGCGYSMFTCWTVGCVNYKYAWKTESEKNYFFMGDIV